MRIFFSVVIVLLGFAFNVSAQQITAQLLDKADKQPIAYANIGILGSDMGTNSDDNGNFSISIGKEQEEQIISISLVGYQTYKVKVAEFENQLKGNSNKLYLQKQENQLGEVVVRPTKYTFARLGNDVHCDTMEKGSLPFPYLFKRKKKTVVTDTLTEIGTLMKVSHKKTFIDSVQINIGYCTYEHILYRLNIYEEQDGTFKNILTEPIYINLDKDQVGRAIKVNLTSKNLVVNNNFIVSIEKVKDLGSGAMSICGKLFGAAMYARISSRQDDFIKLPMIGMGLNAFVTFSELEK